MGADKHREEATYKEGHGSMGPIEGKVRESGK